MHGRKIVHVSYRTALWHAIQLTIKRKRLYHVYVCKWGQWYQTGETSAAHLHVGRRRKIKNRSHHRRIVT